MDLTRPYEELLIIIILILPKRTGTAAVPVPVLLGRVHGGPGPFRKLGGPGPGPFRNRGGPGPGPFRKTQNTQDYAQDKPDLPNDEKRKQASQNGGN